MTYTETHLVPTIERLAAEEIAALTQPQLDGIDQFHAGGAEAVAINDQRLTGLSAIRSAGDAVLVDLQPLVGPYRVEAIGDPDTLRTSLLRSGTSDYLQILGTQYGIRSSVTTQSRLDLPGRSAPTCRARHRTCRSPGRYGCRPLLPVHRRRGYRRCWPPPRPAC